MNKQHNDPDKSSDLSNEQPMYNDLSRTIEFTEEDLAYLRRPNKRPLDGDYFDQNLEKSSQESDKEELTSTELESSVDSVKETMDDYENESYPEDEFDTEEDIEDVESTFDPEMQDNEFRYKPLRERQREQERLDQMNQPNAPQEKKVRKKILGDLFKPSFEEHYDMNELENITEYNQYTNKEMETPPRKSFLNSMKTLFTGSKTDDYEEYNLEEDEFYDEEDERANREFEEEVNQTDWLNQDDYIEDLIDGTDAEKVINEDIIESEEESKPVDHLDVYPTESGIEAPEDEESEIEEIDRSNEVLDEEFEEDIEFEELDEKADSEELDISDEDEDLAEGDILGNQIAIKEIEYNQASKSKKSSDLTDKDMSDEELETLSTKISQETAAFDEPILTDQALNEYYNTEDDIQVDTTYEDEDEISDEVESDKAGVTVGASWLTIGNVLSRIIGALYVIPWATWLGAEYTQANVLYSIGYKPYSLILAIATAGFPSSIAKQMAYFHSKKEYKTADKLFKNSLIVMLITGIFSAGLLFVIAPLVAGASSTTNVSGATAVIRSLAPALLILPIMSLLRGYFQGFNDMKPTAISQIIEQFARVGYLLAATYAVMMIYNGEVTTAVVHSTFAAFVGALLSLIYLIFEYLRRLPVIRRLLDSSVDTMELSFQESLKVMIVDSIPFILLGSGIIIAQLVDQFTFGQILSSTTTLLFSEISEMYGALSLDVDKLVMIIISLAVSLASSLVPTISKLFARRDVEGTTSLVEHILTLFTIVMVPAALGMASIADNIYTLFYPNGYESGPSLLVTASVSSIVLGAYTVLSTILQSMNYRRLAARFLIVGLIVKAVLQFPAVALFEGHGALISTAIAFLVSSILMWMKLNRELNFNHNKLLKDISKILVASALMTISAVMWNESLNLLFGPVGRGLTFLKIVIVIVMAVLTYGSILAITNMLPVLIGNRFKDLQDKMRLM